MIFEVRRINPSTTILNFTLGYKNSVAGSFYLNYLQYSGICEQNPEQAPSNNQGNTLGNILDFDMPPSRCNLSWSYHMLDVISEMVPRFRSIYILGGVVLSVIVDDREGARRIFEKGLKYFPNDQNLNFRAGYHYLYEIQDKKRAAELFNVSLKNGGAGWLASLIAGIYTESGQTQIAKVLLEDFLRTEPTGYAKQRAEQKLKEIRAILAK